MSKTYKNIQEIYMKETNNKYGEIIPLSHLEPFTATFLQELLDNVDDIKFKYELLTFPVWASKEPLYKCGNDYYNHIRLKKSII